VRERRRDRDNRRVPEVSLVRAVRHAAVIIGAWALAAAFFAWQANDIAVRRGDPDEYVARLIETASPMLVWALLTPLLLYVGHRFPIRKPHRVRNAMLLCAAAAGVALLRASADVMLMVTYFGVLASLAALFHAHLTFAVVVLGIANFIRLEEENKIRRHTIARSEVAAAEALLRQLRADLSPHFLFNTLNAVAVLLHDDPKTAERMLDKVCDFLRNAVATEHAREVRLADELELVSSYFDLQMMRFGRKLTAIIEVSDPALRDAAIPPLLLQPLIENAIVHGIAHRRDGGCVAVLVDRRRDSTGTWLRIDVRDNGPGFDPKAGGGRPRVGLANVATRLESMYGASHALRYLRIGEAFVARLLIPLTMKDRA
jgi:two-component system, LytTR family, sensor kinase